jgi:hypothetical protein
VTVFAAQIGMMGFAEAQSGDEKSAFLAAIKPGNNKAFAALK